jgi:hypothetical protein
MPRPAPPRALAKAIAAVRSTDPAAVESALEGLSGRRRWLKPLAYAAGTVAVVFDGVLLLIRNWRLTLLQLAPATWIWVMTWNLKHHLLKGEELPAHVSAGAAVVLLTVAQIAYWCNATFAFTMAQGTTTDIRAAFREARPHWRLVGGLALLTGALQSGVWLLLPHMRLSTFWIALLSIYVVQLYLFVAIPSWLLGVRASGPRRERTIQGATTGALSAVASTPGFLLNRIGLLLLGVGSLWIVGVVILAIGAVLHVTASSSVRVVKMSLKLRAGGSDEATPPSVDEGTTNQGCPKAPAL